MGHFADEPHSLHKLKWVLLALGTIAIAIFALEYISAWVYPIVSMTYGEFVLMHLFHLILISGTIIIKNATVQTPAFGVYIGTYVICALMDIAGCITRTIYFHQSNLSVTSFTYFFGLILLVIEWLLPVISIIQVILTSHIAKLTSQYMELQDFIVINLTQNNGLEHFDETTKYWLEEYKKKLGLEMLHPEQPEGKPKSKKKQSVKKDSVLKGISDKLTKGS